MRWNTIAGFAALSSYTYLAEVYDPLMDDAQNGRWSDYILDLLKSEDVLPPSRILETACGTGRITLALAEFGYDMMAMDLSEEMLLIAQDKLRTAGLKAQFASGDMTDFILPSPVDAVLCACDGVNYLTKPSDMNRFFEMCRENLSMGGILMFDISSYNKLTNKLGNNFFYDDREGITCFWQNQLSGDLLTMELTLFVEENGLYKRMDEQHVQKAYKISEIKQALENTGFGQIRCFDFFTKEEACEANERIQFIAVRNN